MVSELRLRERRNHDVYNSRPRSPSIPFRRRHVIPPTTVLVVRDDDNRAFPLRSTLDSLDYVGEMPVTRFDIGVTRMHVQIALWLVESHSRQPPCVNIRNEFVGRRIVAQTGVAQVLRPSLRARSKAAEIIERLMVILEIGNHAGVAMRERIVPAAAIPCPVHAFVR